MTLARIPGGDGYAYACDNPLCARPLHYDHVVVTTTRRERRFCDMYCVAEGHEAVTDAAIAKGQRLHGGLVARS